MVRPGAPVGPQTAITRPRRVPAVEHLHIPVGGGGRWQRPPRVGQAPGRLGARRQIVDGRPGGRQQRVGAGIVGDDSADPDPFQPLPGPQVGGRMHADNRHPGGPQPADGLTVQAAQVGRHDRYRGLAGGGDGQHIADVDAAAQHRHRRARPIQRGNQLVLPALAAAGGQQAGVHPPAPLTRTTIGSPVGSTRTSLSAVSAASSTDELIAVGGGSGQPAGGRRGDRLHGDVPADQFGGRVRFRTGNAGLGQVQVDGGSVLRRRAASCPAPRRSRPPVRYPTPPPQNWVAAARPRSGVTIVMPTGDADAGVRYSWALSPRFTSTGGEVTRSQHGSAGQVALGRPHGLGLRAGVDHPGPDDDRSDHQQDPADDPQIEPLRPRHPPRRRRHWHMPSRRPPLCSLLPAAVPDRAAAAQHLSDKPPSIRCGVPNCFVANYIIRSQAAANLLEVGNAMTLRGRSTSAASYADCRTSSTALRPEGTPPA